MFRPQAHPQSISLCIFKHFRILKVYPKSETRLAQVIGRRHTQTMENTRFNFYLLLTDGAFILGWVVLDVSNFTTLFISEAIFDPGPLEKLNIF